MKTQEPKIGVIGAGRWGQNIVRTFNQLGVLAAIAETSDELREVVCDEYQNAWCYASDDILFADDELDAIAIATPAVTHFNLACKALDAGKHVFVEKPMAMTLKEAKLLEQKVKDSGKILMVGHLLLFQSAIQFIKNFLDEGKLGKIISMRQVRRNLGTVRSEENAMYSLGVHDVAVLQYLIDAAPKSVLATGQAFIKDGVEDDVSVHIRYDNEVQAHIHVSWLWPMKNRELFILGENGALHFDELQQTVTWHKNTVIPEKQEQGSEVIFKGNNQPLVLELAHFIDCIKTGSTPISGIDQGVVVTEILQTISDQLTNERTKNAEPSNVSD